MSNYRQARINEMMSRELCEIIRDVKDYRVTAGLVSITGAECAADLKTAKIFFSVIGADPNEVKKGLQSAHGFIRTQLAQRMNLRETPTLRFIPDTSMERGANMAPTFKKIEEELKKADERDAREEAERLKEEAENND